MVAVMGAGNWGKNLVRNFRELGALEAVIEVSADLRATLSKQYPDLTIYDSPEPVWRSSVSAVAIATPAPTHYQVVKDALLAGKDVFVEKPFVLNVEEGKELIELAKKNDRIIMVGHLLLYQPAIQQIKQYLRSGQLGTVHSFHQKRLNLGKARAFENSLWSLGVHDVAVLLDLIGMTPSEIKVSGQCALSPQVEDDVTLHLHFPHVQAHLHTSWLWPVKQRSLTIIGSEGMLIYDELAQQVVLHKKGITPENLSNWDDGETVLFEGGSQPLRLELQHFLDCVKDRKTPLSDGASSLAVIEVLSQAEAVLSRYRQQAGEKQWTNQAG